MEVFWPIEGNRAAGSLLRMAETSLVPACLALYTGSRSEALAQFGILRGMTMPLLTFPLSLLGMLSGLLMPEAARANAGGNQNTLRRLAQRTIALTLQIALFAGAFFTLWGRPLAQLLYHEPAAGYYLLFLGPVIPFMYLESMIDGIMKGIGEQLASFRYELFNFILRLLGIVTLLPRCGIMGYVAVIVFSNLFTCLLNLRRMLQVLCIRFSWEKWIIQPCAFLLFSLLVCMAAQELAAPVSANVRMAAGGGSMILCEGLLLWHFVLRRQIFSENIQAKSKRADCSKTKIWYNG